jgi:hypothetical protein
MEGNCNVLQVSCMIYLSDINATVCVVNSVFSTVIGFVYTKWKVVFIIVIYYTYSKHTVRVVLEDWVMVCGFKCCSKPIVF